MMISGDGSAVFIEVPKTGSTAAATLLRQRGWWQNGSRSTRRIPGTAPGRHAFLTDSSVDYLRRHGMTSYGVVRNPWDRMASLWRASAPGTQTFLDYMRIGRFKHGGVDILHFTQDEWLYGVDHVIPYEDLARTWEQLSHRFGHLPKATLPQVNVSKNRAKPQWTRPERDIVAARFARDIERWGYKGPSK